MIIRRAGSLKRGDAEETVDAEPTPDYSFILGEIAGPQHKLEKYLRLALKTTEYNSTF